MPLFYLGEQDLRALVAKLVSRGEKLMASLQEVLDELDAIKAGVLASNTLAAELKAQVKALQEQVANGGVVSQQDLDLIDAKADAILDAQKM